MMYGEIMVKWSNKTRITGMDINELLDTYEDDKFIEPVEYAYEAVYNEMEED